MAEGKGSKLHKGHLEVVLQLRDMARATQYVRVSALASRFDQLSKHMVWTNELYGCERTTDLRMSEIG